MGTISTRRFVSLVAVVAILGLLHFYRPETSSLWFDTFYDWLHVPVFAFVAISLFHALGQWRSNVNKAILAFGATLVLAVLSEAAQIPTSRDASWADIISNITGAAIGLLAIPTMTPRVRLKVVSRAIAFVLLVISCVPLMRVSAAYVERNGVFPVIYNSNWPTREEFVTQRGMAIDFRNLYPDWRNYRTLVVDIEVESAEPFPITIRVHDKQHLRGSQPRSDRFVRSFVLDSGRGVIEILLSEIEDGPETRSLDLSRVDGLVLYSAEEPGRHSVRLHQIGLE